MFASLFLALFALVTLVMYIKWHYSYWKSRKFPHVEASFPFGSLAGLCLGKEFLGDAYKAIYDRFPESRCVGLFHYLTPVLMVKDPEELKRVLTKEFESFTNRDERLDDRLELMPSTLFHMQDRHEWKELRGLLARAFTSSRLRAVAEEMCRAADGMMADIAPLEGRPVEAKELLADYTTRLAFSAFFGMDVDTSDPLLRDVRASVATPRLTTRVRMSLYNLAPQIPLLLRVRVMPKFVNSFFMDLARDVTQLRKDTDLKRDDVFGQLLDAMNTTPLSANGKPLNCKITLDTIGAQCFLFFAASYDSTSSAMGSTLRCLAEYPEIQERLHKEIDSVLKKHNGEISCETIKSMTYLNQVFCEALRIMPPIPEVTRKCTKAYTTTDGLVVEAGVRVVVPVYAIHRDPAFYPRPNEFDPERFPPDFEPTAPDNYVFLPFGVGPRSCLGRRFGVLLGKIGLVKILSKYRIERDPAHKEFPISYSPKIFVVSVPKEGFWVKFCPRTAT